MSTSRQREDDLQSTERSPKRTKLDDEENQDVVMIYRDDEEEAVGDTAFESLLPPSHKFLNAPPTLRSDGMAQQVLEKDVGISEYIGYDVPQVGGIIKQR